MPKALAILGMAIAVLMLVMFGLDALVGIPFGQSAGVVTDVGFLVAAALLAYMSWHTLREIL
jgi:hypothetical protein